MLMVAKKKERVRTRTREEILKRTDDELCGTMVFDETGKLVYNGRKECRKKKSEVRKSKRSPSRKK